MSLEIKNLVVNVHVSGVAAETVQEQMDALRSDVLEECKELIQETAERAKDR
jgi:hypothetical protein